jgi:hypothetical protein
MHMPINELSYFVGRVNLMPTRPEKNAKRELFSSALNSGVTIKKAQFEWAFLDVQEIVFENSWFFTGFLVKFKPESSSEVASLQTKTLEKAAAMNLVEAKARFFVDVETGIIFYHPSLPKIRRDGFETKFEQLFEEGLGKFFVDIEIDPIKERFSIIEELPKFDVITLVDITLRPSNPDNSDLWEDEDKKLKKWNAKCRRDKLYGSEENGGLNIKDDPEIRRKLFMAEDGYGDALIGGKKNGKRKRVSSRDAQIQVVAPNDESDANLVLLALTEVMRSLVQRHS